MLGAQSLPQTFHAGPPPPPLRPLANDPPPGQTPKRRHARTFPARPCPKGLQMPDQSADVPHPPPAPHVLRLPGRPRRTSPQADHGARWRPITPRRRRQSPFPRPPSPHQCASTPCQPRRRPLALRLRGTLRALRCCACVRACVWRRAAWLPACCGTGTRQREPSHGAPGAPRRNAPARPAGVGTRAGRRACLKP